MRARGPCLLLALAAGGCELQEVTVVDFADVVVGEVYVTLRPPSNFVQAFLHGTAAGGTPDSETFDDAVVSIARDDGFTFVLSLTGVGTCVDSLADGANGSCFLANPADAGALAPGDQLELAIDLADGRRLLGALTIPGDFQIFAVPSACRLVPDTLLELSWSRSAGAWAYVNETSINGLPSALASEGIEADDPLYLFGLSISATDTTVVFPSQFGVFDRFDLDQDLALRLQRGLPDGTDADVTITAVERNYVNWARGGNFNPSGQVRVASLRGDGTGVFGAAVVRRFTVIASSAPVGSPDCPLS